MSMQDVKMEAEIDLMKATTAKMWAERAKMMREAGVIPFVAGAGVAMACTTVMGLILKYLMGH